jgi:hypothetical protein
MDENSAPYEEILAEHGAEFRGIQQGPRETLILFADPELRMTLAVPESDFSSQSVSQRLQKAVVHTTSTRKCKSLSVDGIGARKHYSCRCNLRRPHLARYALLFI